MKQYKRLEDKATTHHEDVRDIVQTGKSTHQLREEPREVNAMDYTRVYL